MTRREIVPTLPAPIPTHHFFDALFHRARKDGMLILDAEGLVLRLNPAFSTAFGYSEVDLRGAPVSTLFNKTDNRAGRPGDELACARRDGSASSDGYVMHKNGTQRWATGEVYFVEDPAGEGVFVKTLHRIGADRLLDKFLFETDELVDTVFRTLDDAALAVVDSRLRLMRVNDVFAKQFGTPALGLDGEPVRLSRMTHPLWKCEVVRQRFRELLVTGKSLDGEVFPTIDEMGEARQFLIRTKVLDGDNCGDRHYLLMVRDMRG